MYGRYGFAGISSGDRIVYIPFTVFQEKKNKWWRNIFKETRKNFVSDMVIIVMLGWGW